MNKIICAFSLHQTFCLWSSSPERQAVMGQGLCTHKTQTGVMGDCLSFILILYNFYGNAIEIYISHLFLGLCSFIYISLFHVWDFESSPRNKHCKVERSINTIYAIFVYLMNTQCYEYTLCHRSHPYSGECFESPKEGSG